MTQPWIGEESEPWRVALCSYSAAPGEPHCSRDATWHGVHDTEPVSLPSCDEHLPIMRGLVHYVHPLVHPCCIPGSLFHWPENECRIDWDEQSEFAAALESAGAL